jgi:hypothetical protein
MAAKIDEEPPLVPPKINPFWKENAKKLVGESISTMESVAKEIIVVAGLLEGLYFHAITFSDLRGSLSGDLVLIYLAPIALWLGSLFFAMWTLMPEAREININSTDSSKETFEKIVADKHLRLMAAEGFLLASLVFLLIAVYFYLTTSPPA